MLFYVFFLFFPLFYHNFILFFNLLAYLFLHYFDFFNTVFNIILTLTLLNFGDDGILTRLLLYVYFSPCPCVSFCIAFIFLQ